MSGFVLRKGNALHLRMAEVLRGLVKFGGTTRSTRPWATEFFIELARRGALDRIKHFERYKGDIVPSWSAQQLMKVSLNELLERKLIERLPKYRGTYFVTNEGVAVLEHYDNPTVDAIIRGPARPGANIDADKSVGRSSTLKVH